MICMIAAISKNNQIGLKGKMPWHLPEDLKYFKAVTLHHPVIMGRKTYESIGRPLTGRLNIVLTHDPDFHPEHVHVLSSLEEALKLCQQHPKVFIIGGGEIYQAFLPYADRLYLTLIDQEMPGDTTFPDYASSFQCLSAVPGKSQTPDGLSFHFTVWDRRSV